MKLLQVKQYHREVSYPKWQRCDKTKCVLSMFYFMLQDNKGYCTELRKRGYVAYNDTTACFGMTREKAIAGFNQ